MNDIIRKPTPEYIKGLLAEQIGVEPDDIKDEDAFSDELHMSAADLSDFSESLTNSGIDTSKLDLTQIETVGDLLEALSSEEIA